MADGADDPSVHWVEPRLRAILPLDGFHLSRSLRKLLLADRFRVTTDTVFPAMMALCAEAADDRPTTWINPVIRASYERLFRMGHAHSVECWHAGELVGGLYGVSLGRAFFGESMVSRARDASKVALAHLVARLIAGGWRLLDGDDHVIVEAGQVVLAAGWGSAALLPGVTPVTLETRL